MCNDQRLFQCRGRATNPFENNPYILFWTSETRVGLASRFDALITYLEDLPSVVL